MVPIEFQGQSDSQGLLPRSMYLRKQEAQELHDEAEQLAEEGLQKSSGAIACQPSLQQKLTRVLFDPEAYTLGLNITLKQKGCLRPTHTAIAGVWESHQAQLCLSNPLLARNYCFTWGGHWIALENRKQCKKHYLGESRCYPRYLEGMHA